MSYVPFQHGDQGQACIKKADKSHYYGTGQTYVNHALGFLKSVVRPVFH